ncbi:MAG: Zn-dependent exopeptidase M28 [Spirochaetaceae bacterium]|jgi:hypothetical protein|nr:Zn-dependent exopeptidase M28 [Spirochaetaceae bacterium]
MPGSPYHRFDAFIAPGADRLGILTALLGELHLGCRIANIAGNRHLFVFSGSLWRNLKPGQVLRGGLPITGGISPVSVVLVAHYDRAADSPGANDNSAAVFQLIEAALRLREEGQTQWLIIFTDKEELKTGEGIKNQGAYTLATILRESVLRRSRFFIFDACGSGDTLVISTMTDHLLHDEYGPGIPKTLHLARQLRSLAMETARELHIDRVLLAPTPFSDDAGFLRAGMAAQTITVLPAAEAAQLASLLRNKPDFIDALISREARNSRDELLLPETWRCLNGPGDGPRRLTPRNYKQVVRFAAALCGG